MSSNTSKFIPIPGSEYIVCAAIKLDNHIICGARHFDSIMRNTIQALNIKHFHAEQGFIDQYCRFYTREEAYKIAVAKGQIRRDHDITGRLFSEHLY